MGCDATSNDIMAHVGNTGIQRFEQVVHNLTGGGDELAANPGIDAMARTLDGLQIANPTRHSADVRGLDALKATLKAPGGQAPMGLLALRGASAVAKTAKVGKPTPAIPYAIATGDDAMVKPQEIGRAPGNGRVQTILVQVSASMNKPADPAATQPKHYRRASVVLAAVPGSTIRVYSRSVKGEDGNPQLLGKFSAQRYQGAAKPLDGFKTSFALAPTDAWRERVAEAVVPDGWVSQSFELPCGADWLPEDTLLITQERGNHPESEPIAVPLQASAAGRKRSDPVKADQAELERLAQLGAQIESNRRFAGILSTIEQGLRAPENKGAVCVSLQGLPSDFELKVVNPLNQSTETFRPDAKGDLRASIDDVCDGDGLQFEVHQASKPFETSRVAVEVGAARNDSALQERFNKALDSFSPAAKALATDLFLPAADGKPGPLQHAEDWGQALLGYIIGSHATEGADKYSTTFNNAQLDGLRLGLDHAVSTGVRPLQLPEAVVHAKERTSDGNLKKKRIIQRGPGETWRWAIQTPASTYQVKIFGLPNFEVASQSSIDAGGARFTM